MGLNLSCFVLCVVQWAYAHSVVYQWTPTLRTTTPSTSAPHTRMGLGSSRGGLLTAGMDPRLVQRSSSVAREEGHMPDWYVHPLSSNSSPPPSSARLYEGKPVKAVPRTVTSPQPSGALDSKYWRRKLGVRSRGDSPTLHHTRRRRRWPSELLYSGENYRHAPFPGTSRSRRVLQPFVALM